MKGFAAFGWFKDLQNELEASGSPSITLGLAAHVNAISVVMSCNCPTKDLPTSACPWICAGMSMSGSGDHNFRLQEVPKLITDCVLYCTSLHQLSESMLPTPGCHVS